MYYIAWVNANGHMAHIPATWEPPSRCPMAAANAFKQQYDPLAVPSMESCTHTFYALSNRILTLFTDAAGTATFSPPSKSIIVSCIH
jgi:hypothetical protein